MSLQHWELFVSHCNSDLWHLCCFRAELSEQGCLSWAERTVSISLFHNCSTPTLHTIISLEREMSMYVYRERKCVAEKQLSPGTNCFPWAFALKFLAMINENVWGYDLLLAVSNSLSPSVALFFISLASWSRESFTSLLAPSYTNVLCWAAFPDPHPRHVHCLLQFLPWYISRQARGSWTTGYLFNIYKKYFRSTLQSNSPSLWTFSFLALERRSF